MTKKKPNKRTARTGDAAQAGSRKSAVLNPFSIIPDSEIEYKYGLAAVYQYILSVEWGRP